MQYKRKLLEKRPFRVAFTRVTCGVPMLFSLLELVEFLLI